MIALERRGEVAVLTLEHGKASAFDLELCEGLIARFKECEAAWCGAVVVTGRGSIFSAGVDLLRVVDEGAPYLSRFLPRLSDAFEQVFAFSKPLVAAVNGHAIAGGCILACTADRRLMARGGGRIGLPELLVGVAFPPVPLEIVRFAVNQRFAANLMFNGATLDADAAAEAGFVDVAVDPDALLGDAIAAAERLAARPAAAFAMTKQQWRAPTLDRMRQGRRELDRRIEDIWSSQATLETIRAYIDRTFKKAR
jgi:enoyl-CoA hydratase/carnithine racemase